MAIESVISQELDLAISELATPKAGHRNDGKTPKASNKMSDSVNGVLAGQRNREVPLDEEGSWRFRIRPSDESVASLTSVWKRLYKMRAGGDSSRATDVDVGGDNEVKRNDTPGTSEEEDEASLRELEENDAFALEVGLML